MKIAFCYIRAACIALCVVFLSFFLQPAQAQVANVFTVQGHIIDKANKPLSFANVTLLRPSDSTVIRSITADEQGLFIFEDLSGKQFVILITRIGYKDHRQQLDIADTAKRILLPAIQLEKEGKLLDEVVVRSRKPLLQVRPDRTIVNVAGSINAIGTSAFELLRKAPGVRISNEDNIIINGKNGMTVYIDGKPSNLAGKDLVDYLKNTPSGDIEAIEIITNPSAEFDAAGNAGIINIRTRVISKFGFNNNISLNGQMGPYNPRYDMGINSNYRNRNINLYGSYTFSAGNYRSTSEGIRRQNDGADFIYFDNPFTNIDYRRNHNYKVGIDYTINRRSSIGFSVNGNDGFSRAYKNGKSSIYKNINNIDSVLYSTSNQPQDVNRNSFNGSYRYADTLGTVFSMDANYGKYKTTANNYQPNRYVDKNGNPLSEKNYQYNSESDIDVRSAKADLKKKIGAGTWGAGVKISNVQSNNKLVTYQVLNGVNKLDTGRTNTFQYDETILAGYLDYNVSVKKWSFNAGIRAERTDVKGVLTTLKATNIQALDSNYLNFFPNASVSYQVNDNNSFAVNYNRRIDRPYYEDLNPFEFIVNELLFSKGNPFLKPQFTDIIRLSHSYKNQLFTSLTYDHIKDFMTGISDTLGDKRTFISPLNIATKRIFGVQVSYSTSFTKWWEFYGSLSARREQVKGKVRNNNYLNQSQNSWNLYASNTFSVGKGFSAEISGFYNSKFMDAPAVVKPQWAMDIGLRKKFLGDALSCSISLSDIFNTLNARVSRDYGGLYYDNKFKWETRVLRLSVTYRFGNKNVANANERASAAEEEARRIK